MFSKSLLICVAVVALVLTGTSAKPSTGKDAAILGTIGSVGSGHGEAQLYVSTPVAAKPDGKKQPLDLYVDVRDEAGRPVEGAKVLARATDFETYVDALLVDVGNGRYMVCAFGYFNGKGPGAVSIHVRATKPGYTPGESDGQNKVGRLCILP